MASGRIANYVWLDGDLVPWENATVHVSMLGWSTLGAIFEGISAYWNPTHRQLYGLQFEDHFVRFANSTKLMRMTLPHTSAELSQAAIDLLRANECREDTRIRPLAFHADATWFGSLADSATRVLITTAPFVSHLGSGATLRCCISTLERVSDNVMTPRAKCVSNYQNSRMALLEAQMRGFDQPIQLNAAGKVAEAPAACLFIVRNGVAVTPSLTSGILESITRQTVLHICRELLEVPIQEREVDRTELYIADEVFLCGTGAEIRPIGSVDDYTIGAGRPGPITRAVESHYHALVRGNDDRYASWRTPIYSSADLVG